MNTPANKFALKYKTTQSMWWQIVQWREKNLPVEDIQVLLKRRNITLNYYQARRTVKQADKTIKEKW